MARIDDELDRRIPKLLDLDGLSVPEFVEALRVLEQSHEVTDKRIMFCSVRNPGNLILLQTGLQHGGCYGKGQWVLLERTENGWRLDAVRTWAT